MRILFELLLSYVASDMTGRRVLGGEFRKLFLKSFQFLQEHVELIIAECRGIVYIIPPVGLDEYFPKLLYPYVCLCFFHNANNLQIYGFLSISAR